MPRKRPARIVAGRKTSDLVAGRGEPTPFPVVGIGGSAGGLEAFTRILRGLAADTGMAFVIIQHLDAQHESLLASLLSQATSMPVNEVRDGTVLEPDHVYVIPPNTLMTIEDGRLKLAPRPAGPARPIDHFFRSLAVERKHAAIGVLLSGSDADGSLGLQDIRSEGGIAIVQSETSAKFPEMPRNAVAAGVVDLVLSPEEIAQALDGRLRGRAGTTQSAPGRGAEPEDSQLGRIFDLLGRVTGADFRGYKRGTVVRRVARRKMLGHYPDWESYISHLISDPSEAAALSEDMLIGVTEFFRDPETFAALQSNILPNLLRDGASDLPLRVWVPGCSTGQEAYSIAICLAESTANAQVHVPIQIFGTDLSSRAITIARAGIYPESQVEKLPPERRTRFFTRTEAGFRIVKPIREMCIFARQNLLSDPPFSRLDLISCRNILIYLERPYQRRAVSVFYFALRRGGYLLTGRADGLRDFSDLFPAVDKRHKFYQKQGNHAIAPSLWIGPGRTASRTGAGTFELGRQQPEQAELREACERIVHSQYVPAWILVNEKLEILHSGGDTAPFLLLPPGRATLTLLKVVRTPFRSETRHVLARAAGQTGPAHASVVEDKQGTRVRITVHRVEGGASGGSGFLIIFAAIPEVPSARASSNREESEPAAAERLSEELALTRERLEAIIDDRELVNQELARANEEIQSSNEELQSINEELETSKEELQSTNEELNTVNDELQRRNEDLNRLNDDLANLLSSTTIPILMLDRDLRIRRTTPAAEHLLNVRPGDIGRPLGEIRIRLSVEDIEPAVREVMSTLGLRQFQVQDRYGRWHLLRVRPYRTVDGVVDGTVLAFIDIDDVRQAELAASASRDFAQSIFEALRIPVVVLRSDLRVRTANRAFFERYGLTSEEVAGQSLETAYECWRAPKLRKALEQVPKHNKGFENFELEIQTANAGRRIVSLNARPILAGGENQILLVIDDITEARRAEEVLLQEHERMRQHVTLSEAELEQTTRTLHSEAESRTHAESALHESEAALIHTREELRALSASLLRTQDEERRRVSRELHDDLSQTIARLQIDVETLGQLLPSNLRKFKRRVLALREDVEKLSNDVRRIAYQIHPATLDHLGLPVAMRSYIRDFSEREGLAVDFTVRKVPKPIPDAVQSSLYRVLQEALRNVAKHAGKVNVNVTLSGGDNDIHLIVHDEGPGFNPASVRGRGGLGLISMQERVRLVDGELTIETAPGGGVLLSVRVPLRQK